MSIESFKVVLVGESGVGKTSIITQFIDQTFQEDIQSTTGGTFSTKSVVCDGGNIKIRDMGYCRPGKISFFNNNVL